MKLSCEQTRACARSEKEQSVSLDESLSASFTVESENHPSEDVQALCYVHVRGALVAHAKRQEQEELCSSRQSSYTTTIAKLAARSDHLLLRTSLPWIMEDYGIK